jgi:hypothetical protein
MILLAILATALVMAVNFGLPLYLCGKLDGLKELPAKLRTIALHRLPYYYGYALGRFARGFSDAAYRRP